MKKILLVLVPVLAVILTGCSTAMVDMEETYGIFKENMTNGYVITEEVSGYTVTLDYTSDEDYKFDIEMDGTTIAVTCGQGESTMEFADEEPVTSTDVTEYCVELRDEINSDLTKNVENEMFYDAGYLVEYTATDEGFEAVGTYDDDTTNSLKINTDGTKLEFKDSTWFFSVETK
ncbi:hypothetical protein RZE82_03455 [Mollicutes bacterium LVI A0039]|nr:hypothetical protein RZE82_03455 [Mollicutes bacterium LVI A0039]